MQASYAEVNGNWTQGVYAGTADLEAARMFPDLLEKKLPGAADITFDDFAHIASLVGVFLTIIDFRWILSCPAYIPICFATLLSFEGTAKPSSEELDDGCAGSHLHICVPKR